jgi:hypothetical protein
MKLKIYILLLLTTSLFAQKVETSIDTTKNKIGAQFTLTLKTKVKSTATVNFPKATNFGMLEVIESYPIDTIKENSNYQLIKKYGLTQFDSGKYVIPRVAVLIDKKPVFSDSIKVEVFNVKVDTLKQKMHDIKPIIQVERPTGNWWKYLLGLIFLAGLLYLGYFLWKKYRKVPQKEIVYNSPIEKATSLLQLLEKKELLQKGEIKEYYSEMTDIARDYIEEAIAIPAKESTTSELILGLRAASAKKKMKLSKETLESLERVLKQADLVKFAKSKPLEFEIVNDREIIEKTIIVLDKSIPVTIDDTSAKAALLKEELRLKKEKKKKRIIAAGIFGFVVVCFITFAVVTYGIDYIKNGFVGHSSKELLNGDWIKSEYGNPSISIETPKVLTRIDVKKMMPKETFAIIKEMQMFGYGSLIENFYIIVSTARYKQDANGGDQAKQMEVDLATVLNGTLQTFEAQGCQNIITKQEEFTTEKGIKGLKGYGTLTMKDQDQKMYYEILLFNQSGGVQQIMIIHKDEEENAKKIAERMLNSVELQIAN